MGFLLSSGEEEEGPARLGWAAEPPAAVEQLGMTQLGVISFHREGWQGVPTERCGTHRMQCTQDWWYSRDAHSEVWNTENALREVWYS